MTQNDPTIWPPPPAGRAEEEPQPKLILPNDAFTAGLGAAIAAVVSAALMVGCVQQAMDFAVVSHGMCGTPAAMIEFRVCDLTPPAAVIPALGWWAARRVPKAAAVARCSTLCAIIAWLFAVLFIDYGG